MIELQEHNGKLKVENYGLWEFLQDLQQGINQGYELDESNEGWPQVFGSLYTCLMVESVPAVPAQNQVVKHNELLAEEVQEPFVVASFVEVVAQEATIVAEKETEVKRGPKPKNK